MESDAALLVEALDIDRIREELVVVAVENDDASPGPSAPDLNRPVRPTRVQTRPAKYKDFQMQFRPK